MRSRAEWALRAIMLAALGLLLWTTLRPARASQPARVPADGMEQALVGATRAFVASMSLELDSAPDAAHREWLAAIRRAGTDVSWRAPGLAPIAIGASRAAEPESRVRVTVAGPD